MNTIYKNTVIRKIITFLMSFIIALSCFPIGAVNADDSRVLSSIEVLVQPKITEYVVGDSFDPKGMKVVANYQDGDFKNLLNNELTFEYDFSVSGEKEVTISYTEDGITQSTMLTVDVFDSPILSSSNIEAKKGDIVEIPVSISDNIGLMGMKICLSFDDEILKPIDIRDTDYFSNGYVNDNITTSTDNSFYVLWNGTESISDSGKLFMARFECIDTPSEGKTIVEITCDRTDTYTEKYNTISMKSTRSIINISGIKDISVKYNGVSIRKGTKIQLNASTVPEGLDVSWSSSDISVVTVDEDGKITGIEAGTAKIKVYLTEDEDVFKEIDVEVLSAEQIEHDHEWTETILKDSTCAEEGKKAIYCSICGESYEEIIDKIAHTSEDIPAVAPTCENKGYTAGKKCSVCDEILEEPVEIEELGHDWDSGEITKEPTCKEEGERTYHCKRKDCTKTKAETIAKVAHKEVIIPAVSPTCEKKGSTAGKKCSECGLIIENPQEIKALGHNWDSGKVTKQSTCTSEGIKTYSCKRAGCTITRTEVISKKAHTPVIDPAVAATTEKTGLTEGSHCSVCGYVIKKQEVIPKKEDSNKKAEESNKKTEEPAKNNYSNEWVNGKYYDENGQQTREGTLAWCINGTGKWVEDTNGWYPTNEWMKIDGLWYYFKPDGYAAENEYYFGYWFNFDGTWNDQYKLSWKCNGVGWWVEDISGWWPSSSWLKVDGCWYYFNSSGYMVTSQYVDGWWIGADGVCR